MKKLLSTLLALTLTTTLAACQNAGAAPSTTEESIQSTQSSTAEPVRVGVVQIMSHPSLDSIRDSFVETLKKTYPDAEIDCKDAQSDQSNLTAICQKFVGDGVDLIVAIATPTAQAAAAATDKIPVLYSAVSDPGAAKLTGLPNVTGTSDAIPVDQIFALAGKLTPAAKTFGLIYNTSEVNSVSVIENAKKVITENGGSYKEATITTSGELQQAALSLVGKVDAVFTPIDNTVASAMPVLTEVSLQNKLPVYVGADSMVADGGLATVGIDYTVLGARTAQMAVEILGGKSPTEIPFEVMSDFSTILNPKTAESIGVAVPEEIAKNAVVVGQ